MENDNSEHHPTDDDPLQNDNHNNHSSANGKHSESNDSSEDEKKHPDEPPGKNEEPPFRPIKPSDLGLPPNPEMGYIPTQDDLRAAAERALDDISALFLLQKEDEQVIADQLENIASVLLAASQLKGPHQAKAVKLGLQLNYRFWQTHHQENAWLQLMVPLISTTLDLKDKQLQAEVFRAWGIFLYTSGDTANQPKSTQAFQKAMEYAAESGHDDLKLLARIEHFNQQIGSRSEQDVLAEAPPLLAEARRLQDSYFEGRVYLSLARFYARSVAPLQVFQYAQQATVIFWILNDYGLFCQSIAYLIPSLQGQTPHLAYRQQLLSTMEKMSSHIAYPYISAVLYHLWAMQYHDLKLYDEARSAFIKSLPLQRALGTYYENAIAVHMLGLIELRRHRWKLARLFLQAALKRYQKAGVDQIQILHLEYAIAFIPFEQGDYSTACAELGRVLEMAQASPPGDARDWLVKNIGNDIERAKQAMQSE